MYLSSVKSIDDDVPVDLLSGRDLVTGYDLWSASKMGYELFMSLTPEANLLWDCNVAGEAWQWNIYIYRECRGTVGVGDILIYII